MIKFVTLREDGSVRSCGVWPRSYALPDGYVEVSEHPTEDLRFKVFLRDGTYEYTADLVREPDPLTYAQQRAKNYPGLADQLDMLWHAMDNGTIPKAEPFYTSIQAVKSAYPKTT